MNDGQLQTIEQVKRFTEGSEEVEFKGLTVQEKYYWIEEVLIRYKYLRLKKDGKGVIRQYIQKVTGYSRSQVSRLIGVYRRTGRLKKAEYCRHRFRRKYTPEEVRLLARTDELHDWLSGPATKKIMEREYEVYGDAQFSNICRISVAHLYNLRRSKPYLEITKRFTKTKPVVSKIGERGRPDPNGRPGYIRIDTVHQGDMNGQKGVYHINAVDEVVQWEIVLSVERIAENYLVPVLEDMLGQFPFTIRGFHSDNGSEFVNQIVAKLLNKLLIRFTRSRPRHPDDNGLVETKNGSVIRKNLGYSYIPQACAEVLNWYHKEYLNLYVNFHRPCFFPVTFIDDKGRIKKKYPYQKVRTPYEMLKSLPAVETDLRRGVTFEELDKIAAQLSDNQFAERMVKARSTLFKQISRFANKVA
jgi:transposase